MSHSVLVAARRLHGWSQAELGARAGVPRSAVADVEAERRRASAHARDSIAAALLLRPSDIFAADGTLVEIGRTRQTPAAALLHAAVAALRAEDEKQTKQGGDT